MRSQPAQITGPKVTASSVALSDRRPPPHSFYLGLEAFIGPPMLHLADAIKWEHCSAPDASMKLQAHNYGTETTSKIEWHFVVAPTDESLREVGCLPRLPRTVRPCRPLAPVFSIAHAPMRCSSISRLGLRTRASAARRTKGLESWPRTRSAAPSRARRSRWKRRSGPC